MKKLMIAAAAAAVVGGAYAGMPVPGQCNTETAACEPSVFKLTASGKISVNKGDYKTVETLKVTKGLIVANRGTYNEDETKEGWKATVGIFGKYTIADADYTAFTNGTDNVATVNPVGSFQLEKLAAEISTLADANAKFKGATANLDATAKDSGGNVLKTGKIKVSFIADSITTLTEVTQSKMTWTEKTGAERCDSCFEKADLFVLAKAGKTTVALKYEGMDFAKWAVFGKKYADYAAVAGSSYKYSYSLESEMGLYANDLSGALYEANLYMTGFGTAKLSQGAGSSKAAICGSADCQIVQKTALSYNGWFVGGYDDGSIPEEACYVCAETCLPGYLYGGTWKATYDEALSEKFAVADYDDLGAAYLGKELDDILQ